VFAAPRAEFYRAIWIARNDVIPELDGEEWYHRCDIISDNEIRIDADAHDGAIILATRKDKGESWSIPDAYAPDDGTRLGILIIRETRSRGRYEWEK